MKYSRNVKSVKMVRNGVLLKFLTNFQDFRRFQFRRSVYRTYFRNNFRMELVKSLSNSLGYHFQYRRFAFQNLQDSFHRVFHQVLLSWLSNMHLRIKMRINLYPDSGPESQVHLEPYVHSGPGLRHTVCHLVHSELPLRAYISGVT